jgi:hypothetical protein
VRALIAAAIGLAAAFALAWLMVLLAPSGGTTSPEPLVTTVPAHP